MKGLRELRESLGMTQEELAQRAGVCRPTISRLELGKYEPRGLTLKKISRALGTDPREFKKEPTITIYMPNGSYGVMRLEDFKQLQKS